MASWSVFGASFSEITPSLGGVEPRRVHVRLRKEAAADGQFFPPSLSSSLCVGIQVYESKLQELQKQVETRSLVAETPDEEDLEEEEEEEGVYCAL